MQKRNLDEISFIRPILIVQLILVHCFTVFNGGWPPFIGYSDCTNYMWVSRTCYSFMLETFTFVSGYVWAYQVLDLHKTTSLIVLVKKKSERLILPSIVFSLLYLQLFNNKGCVSIMMGGKKTALSVLSGVGHLWYLPLLFWCFIVMWIVERIRISDMAKLMILLVLAILPYPSLPFQLFRVAYYLFYFFVGYKIWQYGDSYRKNIKPKTVMVLWIIFAVVFVGLRLLTAHLIEMSETAPLFAKIVLKMSSTFCKMAYSSIGVIAMYFTAVWFTKKYTLSKSYINIGALCFGVYVYQEFIIKYLYYFTDLPIKVGYIALPWVTFGVTLILSLLLAKTAKSL